MRLASEYPGIGDLSRAYLAGRTTPEAALASALRDIEAWQGRLRAVVAVDAQPAMDAARESLQRIRAGTARPLEGIPVMVKDLMDMRGLPTRHGTSWRIPPEPAREDSAPVRRLREAGAIVFAKTRLLECAYGIVNPEDGPCFNPWNTSRTSGGSSSGSAAGTAAGIGYGGIGTDTGGSIRIPAAYCGVYGLKPTIGMVDASGVLPLSWTLDHVGPLCRTAGDLRPLMAGLTGADPAPADAPRRPKLGLLSSWGRDPVEPDVRRAMVQLVERLRAAGAEVVPVTIEGLDAAEPVLMTICMAEAASVHRTWRHRDQVTYAEMTLQQIRAGELIPAVDYVAALRLRTRLQSAVEQALNGLDALLMPTVGFVAPAEDPVFGDGDAGSAESWFTGPFNITGHPALSCPWPDRDPEGLPIGAQLVGRLGEDRRLCALAERLEAMLGWAPRLPVGEELR